MYYDFKISKERDSIKKLNHMNNIFMFQTNF